MLVHQLVRVELILFNNDSTNNDDGNFRELYEHLCTRMRGRRKREFSMNFQPHKVLESSCYSCSFMDVNVSNNHNVIVVSDFHNSQFQIMDRKTKTLKAIVPTKGRPRGLCIEENFDGNENDAIIATFSRTYTVEKFNLWLVLDRLRGQDANSNIQCSVWSQENKHGAHGIAVSSRRSTSEKNLVFVCEVFSSNILILNSLDGQPITKVTAHCWGIVPIDRNKFIISSQKQELHVMEIDHELKTPRLTPLTQDGVTALGVTYDCVSKLIYAVSGKQKNTVVVFNLHGRRVHEFEFGHLCTRCLFIHIDNETGELLVPDFKGSKIHAFK
ncbi:hypothetical protein C9374_014063 [Naegleria lovaniensis]|uniref:Uncharacterized protein n=1 Tax=Naegleria lovaniensis TaxID=51637 RepID=A0AA88H1Y1_NAELO|nr:uncharacterized protein C9374_014063 [Naegleria lovaniensis]KAG2389503.1 hypothetical protein C9374_014063 [Naegleria lovaniensis]